MYLPFIDINWYLRSGSRFAFPLEIQELFFHPGKRKHTVSHQEVDESVCFRCSSFVMINDKTLCSPNPGVSSSHPCSPQQRTDPTWHCRAAGATASSCSHLQEPAQHPWGQSPQPCTRSYGGIKLYMKSKSEFEISEEEMQISMGTAEYLQQLLGHENTSCCQLLTRDAYCSILSQSGKEQHGKTASVAKCMS